MFEIGRLCIKIAGRDANRKCLVIDIIDDNYVLIDGQTRRRKCNIIHLEPLDKIVKIKKNASHDEVVKELKKIKISVSEKKAKRKKKTSAEEKEKKIDEKKEKKKGFGLFRKKKKEESKK